MPPKPTVGQEAWTQGSVSPAVQGQGEAEWEEPGLRGQTDPDLKRSSAFYELVGNLDPSIFSSGKWG